MRNYGHWRLRAALALRGRSPVVDAPTSHWYDTPRIHACTIADFEELATDLNLTVNQRVVTNEHGNRDGPLSRHLPNLFAWEAIYQLNH